MYQPLTACAEKEGRVEEDLWTKTLVRGGARGVVLKLKFPLIAAWRESIRFVQEDWSRLRVISAWGMRRYNSWGRKVRVARSESGEKVIFECADRSFCGVAAVGIRGTSLKSTLYLQKIFGFCGSTRCRGFGEWGMHHVGLVFCGMSSRL